MFIWNECLRLRLNGTGQIFDWSKIWTVHIVYKEPSLFLHENIFRLHETGYFEIVLRASGYFSAIYHANMRRFYPVEAFTWYQHTVQKFDLSFARQKFVRLAGQKFLYSSAGSV